MGDKRDADDVAGTQQLSTGEYKVQANHPNVADKGKKQGMQKV